MGHRPQEEGHARAGGGDTARAPGCAGRPSDVGGCRPPPRTLPWCAPPPPPMRRGDVLGNGDLNYSSLSSALSRRRTPPTRLPWAGTSSKPLREVRDPSLRPRVTRREPRVVLGREVGLEALELDGGRIALERERGHGRGRRGDPRDGRVRARERQPEERRVTKRRLTKRWLTMEGSTSRRRPRRAALGGVRAATLDF